MKEIKWGILGLGKIANKFAKDLGTVENSSLYAVASRSHEKAQEFAKAYNAPVAYSNYEQLLKDSEVDVVYIATPHVFHYELTKDCIRNGKAVLCEKPFAMNSGQAREMIEMAREKKVFVMEALWTAFLPHFQYVLEKVKSGDLGAIKSIKADFGFTADFDKNSRLFNKNLGGGSLLDIGIYPVFFAHSLLGHPESIQASAEFTETKVDSSCTMNFKYGNDVTAKLHSTVTENTPTTAEIILEKGTIKLNSRFHEPTSVKITSEGDEETITFDVNTFGYNFETAHVAKMLRENKTESDIMSLDRTLEIMKLLDQIRKEIKLEY